MLIYEKKEKKMKTERYKEASLHKGGGTFWLQKWGSSDYVVETPKEDGSKLNKWNTSLMFVSEREREVNISLTL